MKNESSLASKSPHNVNRTLHYLIIYHRLTLKRGNRSFTIHASRELRTQDQRESTTQTVNTVKVKSSSTAIAQLLRAGIFVFEVD